MSFFAQRNTRENVALLLGGIGVGAALMYVLDPEKGRRRRALARDKAVRAVHKTGAAIGSRSRDLGNRARGIAAGTRSRAVRHAREDRPREDRGDV